MALDGINHEYYRAGDAIFFEIDNTLPFEQRLQEIRALKNSGAVCKRENNKFYWFYNTGKMPSLPPLSGEPVIGSRFKGDLFSYQREDVRRILNVNRALLTHDTGLGKTIISLYSLLSAKKDNREKNTSIIVLPKSLIKQWATHIQTRTDLSFHIISKKDIDMSKDINLVTYTRLRTLVEALPRLRFFYAIFDEANAIKNPSTKQTRAACMVNARNKLLLTATPIKSNPSEIYSLFRAMDLSGYVFGSYTDFVEHFAVKQFSQKQNKSFIVGYKNLNELAKRIAPYIIHREKTPEIKAEIGQKFDLLEQYRYIDMDTHQKAAQTILDAYIGHEYHETSSIYYDKTLNYSDSSRLAIFTLSRLVADDAKIAVDSKSETARMLFSNMAFEFSKNEKYREMESILDETNGKTIIFTSFSTVADSVAAQLKADGHNVYLTSGETRNNDDVIAAFEHDANNDSILVSTDVSKYGLDLQFCSNIIHYDLPFTYSELKQRNGRIDRIGQKSVPNVFYLITEGSVDENMLRFIEKKKMYKDVVLNAANNN